jgi:hypothetical protein
MYNCLMMVWCRCNTSCYVLSVHNTDCCTDMDPYRYFNDYTYSYVQLPDDGLMWPKHVAVQRSKIKLYLLCWRWHNSYILYIPVTHNRMQPMKIRLLLHYRRYTYDLKMMQQCNRMLKDNRYNWESYYDVILLNFKLSSHCDNESNVTDCARIFILCFNFITFLTDLKDEIILVYNRICASKRDTWSVAW